MTQENSQNPPNPSQRNPSSQKEEEDEASSKPNVPHFSSIPPPIPQSQDPSSIDPQTRASQDPVDLSLTLALSNQNQPISSNRPEIQESSNFSRKNNFLQNFENRNRNQNPNPSRLTGEYMRRQLELLEMYRNPNQNRPGIQDSSNDGLGAQEHLKFEARFSRPLSLPAAQRPRIIVATPDSKQSIEEIHVQNPIRQPPATETRTTGVEEALKNKEWIERKLKENENKFRALQELKDSLDMVIPESPAPVLEQTSTFGTGVPSLDTNLDRGVPGASGIVFPESYQTRSAGDGLQSLESGFDFDPNVPLIVEPISWYPDPFSITSGIDPQTQEFIKSFGPTDFSSILGPQYQNQDLELEMHLSAIEQFENKNQNQESSSFLRRQKEEYERYQNLNRNQSGIQDYLIEFSGIEEYPDFEVAASTPEILQQDSRPPAKIHRRQSSLDRDTEFAILNSLGTIIQDTPAPERGASGGVIEGPLVSGLEETRTAAPESSVPAFDQTGTAIPETQASVFTETREFGASEKEEVIEISSIREEGNRFLLSSSTSEEEDDYCSMKFLLAFRLDGGSLLPWPALPFPKFPNYLKKYLPDCETITELGCQNKYVKLYHLFMELCAKFHGGRVLDAREYKMFKMGRSIWGETGSSTSGNPECHGPDPEANDPGIVQAVEDPEDNAGQGNGADQAANVDPGAGDPNVNVDQANGADENPTTGDVQVQQGGDNAGLEDPGENVGHGAGADPTEDREAGADPTENMDLD